MKSKIISVLLAAMLSSYNQVKASEDRSKWAITIDYVMIIGKYFESNNDYINVMKVCKKYERLTLMYKFNPISDPSLFENIETQHFYKREDIEYEQEGMWCYVYWFPRNYDSLTDELASISDITTLSEIYDKEKSLRKKHKRIRFSLPITDKDHLCVRYLSGISNGKCELKQGITEIMPDTFKYCLELKIIVLPESLVQIGDGAFIKTNIAEITIPEGVTQIGSYCFMMCSKLEKATLPTTLKEISEGTFANTGLVDIIVPEGVSKLGNYSFSYCYQLTNIILPSSLREIGDEVFCKTKISNIDIPSCVSKMGKKCFVGCDSLTGMTMPCCLLPKFKQEITSKSKNTHGTRKLLSIVEDLSGTGIQKSIRELDFDESVAKIQFYPASGAD